MLLIELPRCPRCPEAVMNLYQPDDQVADGYVLGICLDCGAIYCMERVRRRWVVQHQCGLMSSPYPDASDVAQCA